MKELPDYLYSCYKLFFPFNTTLDEKCKILYCKVHSFSVQTGAAFLDMDRWLEGAKMTAVFVLTPW